MVGFEITEVIIRPSINSYLIRFIMFKEVVCLIGNQLNFNFELHLVTVDLVFVYFPQVITVIGKVIIGVKYFKVIGYFVIVTVCFVGLFIITSDILSGNE